MARDGEGSDDINIANNQISDKTAIVGVGRVKNVKHEIQFAVLLEVIQKEEGSICIDSMNRFTKPLGAETCLLRERASITELKILERILSQALCKKSENYFYAEDTKAVQIVGMITSEKISTDLIQRNTYGKGQVSNSQHLLIGRKRSRSSIHATSQVGERKLPRAVTPAKNLPITKLGKSKKIRRKPCPIFMEHRPMSATSDVFHVDTARWFRCPLELRDGYSSLTAYAPDILIECRDPLLGSEQNSISDYVSIMVNPLRNNWNAVGRIRRLSNPECRQLVSLVYEDLLIFAGRGMQTRVYRFNNMAYQPSLAPPLPIEITSYAHCIQANRHLFVLAYPGGTFTALTLGHPMTWSPVRSLFPGEYIVMAGVYGDDKLIVVSYTNQLIEILAINLGAGNLPEAERQVLATAPQEAARQLRFNWRWHPEDKIRMCGHILFLYERPHLYIFDLNTNRFTYRVNNASSGTDRTGLISARFMRFPAS